MEVGILESIIRALDDAGYEVVAVVCDMGSTNRKFNNDLGSTKGKTYHS